MLASWIWHLTHFLVSLFNFLPVHRPRLPLELIDMIIDLLHDDQKSLRACSIVCKTWTCSARFHLFSKSLVRGQDVKLMLELAPAVVPFIPHLRLDERQWDEVVPLLVRFESVRSLAFNSLPPHCLNAQAMSALFHNVSTVTNVRLNDVQFSTTSELIHFICAFPCLQMLSINCAWPSSHEDAVDLPNPSTFSPSPHLRGLELNCVYMDAVLDWFLSLPDRPPLHTVGLYPNDTNKSETITKLLSALGNSLETFVISTAVAKNGSPWPFDFRHNTCLRCFQMEIGSQRDEATLVTQILSQISSLHIEEVGLEVSTLDYDADFVGELGWLEIDDALQHPSFSGLKKVTIRVVQTPLAYGWDICAGARIMDSMSECYERGILNVHDAEWESSFFSP